MPKTLADYQCDEVRTLLEELRYRADNEDDVKLVNEIDSVLGLFMEEPEVDEDE